MKDWILTVDDLLDRHPLNESSVGEVYKFVKVNGDYRFVVVDFCCPDHADLVEEGEVGESAGNIRVATKDWRMLQWYSSTLGIQATAEDEEALTRLLGRPSAG